jgi:tight adherence protein C
MLDFFSTDTLTQSLLLPVLAALAAAGAVLSIVAGLHRRNGRLRFDARLEAYIDVGPVSAMMAITSPENQELRQRSAPPLAARLAELASRLLPDRQIERTRRYLVLAGLPYNWQLTYFLAAKVGVAAATAGVAAVLLTGEAFASVALMAMVGAVLGFYLPNLWLGRRIAQRRAQLRKALPDVLDLLSISIGAGLGFEGALLEVVRRWENPLTVELRALLRDIRLGKGRREALREMAARTGTEEITGFVSSVLQAEETGMALRTVLHVQADQMRVVRRQAAEELARKATIKMLFPLMIFIFPSMFVVLVGPAVPGVLKFLG